MDISHWPQDLGMLKSDMEKLSSINNTATTSNTNSSRPQQSMDEIRNTRPQKEKALNCPRCNSTNTKFCYYNNYSLTQPRYFCKTCRRYWTEGGSLRNVPIGGGSRKNKKPSTPPASTASMSLPNTVISSCSTTTASSKIINGTANHDLNLAFSLVQPEEFANNSISAPFMPLMNSVPPPMSFGMQDLRSNALSCPLDFVSVNGIGGADHNGSSGGRLLFPFEEARRMNYTSGDINGDHHHHHHHQQQQQQLLNKLPEQNGGGDHHYYWNDLISGGGD